MSYIKFKTGNKTLAIKSSKKYIITPTMINKISSKPIQDKLIKGYINLKGQIIKVVDISSEYNQPDLKKFDGLIFIENEKTKFALKYEGFYSIENKLRKNESILDINTLFNRVITHDM